MGQRWQSVSWGPGLKWDLGFFAFLIRGQVTPRVLVHNPHIETLCYEQIWGFSPPHFSLQFQPSSNCIKHNNLLRGSLRKPTISKLSCFVLLLLPGDWKWPGILDHSHKDQFEDVEALELNFEVEYYCGRTRDIQGLGDLSEILCWLGRDLRSSEWSFSMSMEQKWGRLEGMLWRSVCRENGWEYERISNSIREIAI